MRGFKFLVLGMLILSGPLAMGSPKPIKGFSLTEHGEYVYDASMSPSAKTEAQKIVDRLYSLGVRQINLTPRAFMTSPQGVEVVPATPPGAKRSQERQRYLRLIQYIKSKGMKVGIRPIFFVVDSHGNTPYLERQPNGQVKAWWHGNIQPRDPFKWFESFRSYLDIYLAIARHAKVEEFTIGAELYSMTVGIEDQWRQHPHGFPAEWVKILQYAKGILPSNCQIMYDINFTDDSFAADGIEHFGGEFARWKYRLVDLHDASNPHWQNLATFWKGLDAIGIDIYRSLASKNQALPSNYADLLELLQQTSDRYASQIDNTLFEISTILLSEKPVLLKEVGFRSIDHGFIDPFSYANSSSSERLNIMHQAVAYDAIFNSFFKAGWSWFAGSIYWDASIDPAKHGAADKGFSPLGKKLTEDVISKS